MRGEELGAFLRSRRARVDPSAKGFPPSRRRTPGLRREELATLAGVTVSWLTKLEQGRAHAVSIEVLDALGRALDLADAERRHLFALGGYRVEGGRAPEPLVTPPLRLLLDQLEPCPAYLLDRCWNMVAWNAAEERLFPRLQTVGDGPPNLLELVFLDEELAELMADHELEQARLVSQFRSHCAEWPQDPDIARLTDSLRASSPKFAQLWEARDVAPFVSTRRVFDHPRVGRIELDHHRLAVLDQPGMQLVVYTPAPGSAVGDRMQET
ncbi:MAG TPA: helix-turn-helix transcriptional regulator [Actinomycetota bacterium]|nr:helix-turn-helix transcriptional regulator [Actinomycetota bacterium]